MKFDIQTVAHKGTLVESNDGERTGVLIEINHNFDEPMDSSYLVQWECGLKVRIGAEALSDMTVIAAEDDRKFVWNTRGEGYCSHCLGDEAISDEPDYYRLIDKDDSCQCENCGIWAGEAAHKAEEK